MIRSNITLEKIDEKGQKITAALYLLTNHLPESDPIRLELRELSVTLIAVVPEQRVRHFSEIVNLLRAGQLAKIFSEGNVHILETELNFYCNPRTAAQESIGELFTPLSEDKGQILLKRTNTNMSFISRTPLNSVSEKKPIIKEDKNKRQEQILSFINQRKSANIKDISSLFPQVSEKTIQRELGSLVAAGKISKRGDKRWSIYLSIR